MRSSERRKFAKLKSEIVRALREEYPEVAGDIKTWRKKEISLFQKALSRELKSQVSEKWFYTHLKSDHSSLPRIDMLDLLSQFVGYDNWEDFDRKGPRIQSHWRSAFLMTIPLLAGVTWWWGASGPSCSKFCFSNLYGRVPVDRSSISVYLVRPGESPELAQLDEGSCVCLEGTGSEMQLIVNSAYFVNDTITRSVRPRRSEEVALRPDDYAQMIRMFANAEVEDWHRYRANMLEMFAENARIYELMENGSPLALYNREEFVDKLTLPQTERRDLEVLDLSYEGDKINVLRFARQP